MTGWPLKTSDLGFIGEGAHQPECVVALASGDVFASDKRGGIGRIAPGGQLELIRASGLSINFHPNGFSILPGRVFVIANVGDDGGVYSMTATGQATPLVLEVEGRKLPGTNFAGADAKGRVWISVSSWRTPRKLATQKHAEPDGSIILFEHGKARIVADRLAYTNEVRVHPSGNWLYVCETAGRRLCRFRILANSDLGPKETVCEFSNGAFPDGMAFDAEGHCWVACIGSQQIIRIDVQNGAQQLVFDESNADSAAAERKFNAGDMRAWDDSNGKVLGSISGLCFGGPDLRTVYLGSLTRSAIATFRSPVAGATPYCWTY